MTAKQKTLLFRITMGVIIVIGLLIAFNQEKFTLLVTKYESPENQINTIVQNSIGTDDFYTDYNDKEVTINITGDERIDSILTRDELLKDSKTIFKDVYKTGKVNIVNLRWNLPDTDKYGNKTDKLVLKIQLKKETADKINWDNIQAKNLADVADDIWILPSLY